MTFRLARIQGLVLSLTTVMAVIAFCSGLTHPLGIVLGGIAAWLDFVVIKGLAAAMIARRPATAHLLPMALAKSLVLLGVPASALFLPHSVVSGVSFALGVTALPASIAIDAFLPSVPERKTGEA
jgi:hypothetical protein